MALAIVFPFDAWSRLGLHSTPVIPQLEGATQTFLKGAILVASSGFIIEGTSPSPSNIVGIAVNGSSNLAAAGGADAVTGETIKQVYPARAELEYVGQLDATAAGLAQGTHALAQTDVDQQFGVAKDTTSGFWYVNFSDTTNKRVVVKRLIDPIGTLAGRVLFSVMTTGGVTIDA